MDLQPQLPPPPPSSSSSSSSLSRLAVGPFLVDKTHITGSHVNSLAYNFDNLRYQDELFDSSNDRYFINNNERPLNSLSLDLLNPIGNDNDFQRKSSKSKHINSLFRSKK